MDREDFLPIERDTHIRESSFIVRPNWWQRFKVNRLAVIGAGIIAVMIVLAILGPIISPYTYADQSLIDANQSPSLSHWFGTDTLGRDIYTRVMYGARISLTIGIVAALLNLVIGVVYGGVFWRQSRSYYDGYCRCIIWHSIVALRYFVNGCHWTWLNVDFYCIRYCILA